MSVAARTRRAVREDPALYDALRDGVVNYSAAARSLDVEGDEESIATALRRFAEELERRDRSDRRISVRLHRGAALDAACFAGVDLDRTDGEVTAIEARGDVDPAALEVVLGRLRTADVAVHAAGAVDAFVDEDDLLVVAVPKRSGAEALRVVEGALEAT